MMTTTSFDLDFKFIMDEEHFEPPRCEHYEHDEGEHPERHDAGLAKFELVMPCGLPLKVCAQFVAWLDWGGRIDCGRVIGEKHDKSTIVWVPL
jgi:hypothetical protein